MGLKYTWSEIQKEEGYLLRALAIMAILVHNYLHWVSDVPGENEFTFRVVRLNDFLNGMWHAPQDFVRLIATYLGHYGVQVFFFLSGYGLARKYASNTPGWWTFQKGRLRALYPAVLISAVGYLVYDGFRLGWVHVWQAEGFNLLRQILGVSNFIPDNVYHPVGPWWFIGVILQFYAVLPLIFMALRRYGEKVLYLLLGCALLSEFLLGPLLIEGVNLNINHTLLGHLDVCIMGVWFARRGEVSLPSWVLGLAGVMFVMGNFFYHLWVVSGLMLLIFLLPSMRMICSVIRRSKLVMAASLFLGNLSLYLFLCNGYLRRPLIDVAVEAQHWWVSIWTCMVFLLITIGWAVMLRWLQSNLSKLLS